MSPTRIDSDSGFTALRVEPKPVKAQQRARLKAQGAPQERKTWRDRLPRLNVSDLLVNTLTLSGIGCICGGVAWIYRPAGVILAGLCAVGLAMLLADSTDAEQPAEKK
jgi:hypothetical protein